MNRTAHLPTRFALVAAVCTAYAAMIATAGPGNGVEAPRAPHAVVLPTVVVVAAREAQRPAIAVNAAGVKSVNLAR